MYILRIRRAEHAGVAENLSYFRAQTEKLRLLDFMLIGQLLVAGVAELRIRTYSEAGVARYLLQ